MAEYSEDQMDALKESYKEVRKARVYVDEGACFFGQQVCHFAAFVFLPFNIIFE